MTESLNRIPLRMKSTHSQGYQNLIRINKEKGILILGKKISARIEKNILAELLSIIEIDRIGEIK